VKRLALAGATVVVALASTAAAAPEPVTILARPTLLGPNQVVALSGSVDSSQAGQIVTIQAKDCRSPTQSFQEVASARTREGGAWSTEYSPGISTTLRAVWNDTPSAAIAIRQRAAVHLRPLASRNRFRVLVGGKLQFWRKRIVIQRFERRLGTWITVRSVLLTETGGTAGYGDAVTWADLRVPAPRGTLVRALLPQSQARPCYLAGVSRLLRT
jgi:hypothetical protein